MLSSASWEDPLAFRPRSSNVQAGGHGPRCLNSRASKYFAASHSPVRDISVPLNRWAKSSAPTTSPTQHVRPPGFCHHAGPSAWYRLHRSCFQAPATHFYANFASVFINMNRCQVKKNTSSNKTLSWWIYCLLFKYEQHYFETKLILRP